MPASSSLLLIKGGSMIQVPGSKPCWISSIVKLPNFYDPHTVLYGEMQAMTSDLYVPMTACIRQGRNIEIQPGMTKYKLELNINDTIADVVCIAMSEFNQDVLQFNHSQDGIPLFPVFIHIGNQCYMFVKAINDMFSATGMVMTDAPSISPYVISPMCFIERIDGLMLDSCIDINYYNTDLTGVKRTDQIVQLLTACMMNESDKGKILNGLISSYGIAHINIPHEFNLIASIRHVGDLRKFLNPYGSVPSDIAALCRGTVTEDMKYTLVEHGCLPTRANDVYSDNAEDFSILGMLLARIYELPMSDFTFPIRLDDRDCFDLYALRCHVYNDFKHSFERIVDWEAINSCITVAFDLSHSSGEFPEKAKELKAERTWLEDIVIRDPYGNILTYIDMTWWMLACCDGLVNESILDSVTFN